MVFRNFNLIQEPIEKDYLTLVDVAQKCASKVLLVVRDEYWLGDCARETLQKLSDYILVKEQRTQWPGTILLTDKAMVFEYNFSDVVAKIIKESATGLYQWKHPRLPEDLCFLRSDNSVWLASIAHENDGFLSLLTKDLDHLKLSGFDVEKYLQQGHDECQSQ